MHRSILDSSFILSSKDGIIQLNPDLSVVKNNFYRKRQCSDGNYLNQNTDPKLRKIKLFFNVLYNKTINALH